MAGVGRMVRQRLRRLAGSNDFLAGVLQEDYGRERDAVSSEKTSH